MIWTDGQKILKFSHALDFFKNEIPKCKLSLFERLKQPHLKMKNIFEIEMLKACVRYFSLFLKDKCIFRFFERSTLKRILTYSCFFFPLLHEHLFCPGLPRAARLLETS